jgi:alkylation response protein AidB-like acyl-CoA dehydrogenase
LARGARGTGAGAARLGSPPRRRSRSQSRRLKTLAPGRVDAELARGAVAAAISCADDDPDRLSRLASLAKARCSETFTHVANEAIQTHGGIGVTDEFQLGFYLKRARATDVLLGDPTWHLRRWASLGGY